MISFKSWFIGNSIATCIALIVAYGFFAMLEAKLNPFDWVFPSRLCAAVWSVGVIYNYFERMSKKIE